MAFQIVKTSSSSSPFMSRIAVTASFITILILLCTSSAFPRAACGSFTVLPTALGNETDRQALLAFKNGLTGDPLSSWNQSVHFCQWAGVTCGRRHQRVVVLDLDNRELKGPISPHIGNLSFLRELWLRNNSLEQHIPPELGRLGRLQIASLINNSIGGEIPVNISGCSNLVTFAFSKNNLEGVIPASIGNSLSKLQGLHLGENHLAGVIPASLANLSSFRNFYVSGNDIHGSIPDQFGRSKTLEFFGVSFNMLVGTIPPSMFNISSIRTFDTRENLFHGNIPVSLSNASNLITLDLATNNFTGQVPSMEKLKHLTWLSLARNSLGTAGGGDDLGFLCNMSTLEVIDLSHNYLRGVIPQCMRNFSNVLSVLNLGTNLFHGTIPLYLAEGNKLTSITLNNNNLEGEIPRSLANCMTLEVLDLGNNRINDTFPYWLEHLPELQVLVLRSNKFHGRVSISATANVPTFPKLRVFDLSQNDFIGPLPSKYFEIFNAMKVVEELEGSPKYMRGHKGYTESTVIIWKGVVTDVQRVLITLATIDLSGNKFEGEIPITIGSLQALRQLNLSSNCLTGNIPSTLANLTLLESLDLSSNRLSGEIPQQLTSLRFLAIFNLSRNRLVGPVPQGPQFHTFANDSYGGNLGLCGFPLSKKCSGDGTQQDQPAPTPYQEVLFGGFGWKVVLLGYGCGIPVGLAAGYVIFLTGKPKWFVRLVEEDPNKKRRRRSRKRGAY